MAKIDKNRHPRGRPDVKQSKANRTQCEQAFEDGWSASFAAQELNLNRHTVESYYTELREKFVESLDRSFINRQKVAKEKAILELDIDIKEFQTLLLAIDELILNQGDMIPEWNREKITIMKEISELKQKKYTIEMSPTIDQSPRALMDEINEYRQRISKLNAE